MKFIFVLEDDKKVQQELHEALLGIDPQLQVRFFLNLSEFHEWLKKVIDEGPKSLAGAGHRYHLDTSDPPEPTATDELRLVIVKDEFLGTKNMSLIRRARDFFIRKKLCSAEETTSLIITAFDSPEFDIKLAEERIINNVLFKPFDKLILRQHLEWALSGRHPLESSGTVATMKLNSSIEMLKEVPFESYNELGFTTINNHEIEIGKIAKYYHPLFEADQKRALYATCYSCKEISPKEFMCEFLFVGADNLQIQNIRRHILQNKEHKVKAIENKQDRTTHILILEENASLGSDLKAFFAEKFSNVQVWHYTHYTQLLSDLDDKDTPHKQDIPAHFDLVFADTDMFIEDGAKKWEQTLKIFADRRAKKGVPEQSTELTLICQRKLTSDQIREYLGWSRDVFFTPWDRSYLFKKITRRWGSLTPIEGVTFVELPEQGHIKVANPVSITQISEAGVILKYYRAMGVGSFREFILWLPNEAEIPEIIGTCNFSEKEKSGDAFLNHFIFFGMTDLYLKHIRLWLREAYIKQKEKG